MTPFRSLPLLNPFSNSARIVTFTLLLPEPAPCLPHPILARCLTIAAPNRSHVRES